MIFFFGSIQNEVFVVQSQNDLDLKAIKKLEWLFGGVSKIDLKELDGDFIGPRVEMITPWSTNAVEISQNMGIVGIERIEVFTKRENGESYDPMLQAIYAKLHESLFDLDIEPEQLRFIEDISAYNREGGLALSEEEIIYLENLSKRLGRLLTDSEVFGFSQVNSEHCRHKIFNGVFIIDGIEMPLSLFQLIRKTSGTNPNRIVSAYSDNVAFIKGPMIMQFAPEHPDKAAYFDTKEIESILSLKAETHNFPTTVEPFNGAATGTGGEIRDRMAGGKGSMPLGGTAVYMTAYPRTEPGRSWEKHTKPRKWLYQDPEQILIKASNGASDFGNKFGQPLICGSVLTFELFTEEAKYAFDKVIMLAGGVGYARTEDSHKEDPKKGDRIVVMGGDNYRIGMGGGSVSSVATGEYDNQVELNAVQRSNPEMQKRVSNVIRGLAEMEKNPIVSVHDHGAGGHLNALSELIETTGGRIDIGKLPVGDKTLSFKEIIGNESQERMGLLFRETDIDLLNRISRRERAPMYVVGSATEDHELDFVDEKTGVSPIKLDMKDMFGNPPQTVLEDTTKPFKGKELNYDIDNFQLYLSSVLQMEAVACKDWLTNKVDRSVTGKVAVQQCTGEIQLPLNNLGVMALDYEGQKGIATSIGHAPISSLVDPVGGSVIAIAEALTNLIWAPLEEGIKGVSLSANWMWPAKNEGENARLYRAVESISDFAIALGLNVPTGKDSLSMKQQYPDETVYSPGTVIISTVAEVQDINKVVTPEIKMEDNTVLLYVEFFQKGFELGGSSFAQSLGELGQIVPTLQSSDYFVNTFECIQTLVGDQLIHAGHDIGAGGLITTLLEMCFPNKVGGLEVDLSKMAEKDAIKILFSEKPGIVIQVTKDSSAIDQLNEAGVEYFEIAYPIKGRKLKINASQKWILDIDQMRDDWMKSSYLLDRKQAGEEHAKLRYENYKNQTLKFSFPKKFEGKVPESSKIIRQPRAAIIREKGVNGDREMAYALFAAGFEVKDIHMTDLISGEENLEDVKMIVFVGGFSNSDVLGSAKGWAGAFLYNKKAHQALRNFYQREDTLSLGVCNGCQLMVELGLLEYGKTKKVKMEHNNSKKFESTFLGVKLKESNSIMLRGLEKADLGIWVAHGEGKFSFEENEIDGFDIPIVYAYQDYPGNPNGSDFDAAAISSKNGRHLAMMPHLERSIFPWQWAHYPAKRKTDEISPWFLAFSNARNWIANF